MGRRLEEELAQEQEEPKLLFEAESSFSSAHQAKEAESNRRAAALRLQIARFAAARQQAEAGQVPR